MYQEIQGCHRKYKPNTQVQYTNSETRYKEKIIKEQSPCAWFSEFPLRQRWPGVMRKAEHYDLAKIQSSQSLKIGIDLSIDKNP